MAWIFFLFPLQIVRLAVYGMLPRNLQRRTMMQRLHIFPEDVSGQTQTLGGYSKIYDYLEKPLFKPIVHLKHANMMVAFSFFNFNPYF